MKPYFLSLLCLVHVSLAFAQSTVYVRNSTWQDFEVSAQQEGTLVLPSTEWSASDSTLRAWQETTGEAVLTFNRTNTAIPQGDTVYFHVNLNGNTDTLTIRTRVIGLAIGTEMAYSVVGNGFSEPWFDDANFHEVNTTLAGKAVVIKFKPDNDDTAFGRNVRFAIHDLPVYELNAADFADPNVLNIMYYNIQMISFGVSGMGQANDRGALLPAQISAFQDVVCFAEAFDDTPRKDHLIPAMEAAGFAYRTEILNEPTGFLPFPVNGGVIIFSRWPIEAENQIKYAECGQASQDCLASKGMKYARINKLGKRYHVFGTHMDAGGGADDIHARRTQMAEIRNFIADLQIPQSEPVIFGGDFNTNPIGNHEDYDAFLDTINPIIPLYTGSYESNFGDDFGGIIDHAWGDRNHLLPTSMVNRIITIRSLDPSLWDISEFSDHRCLIGRFEYPNISKAGGDTLICPGQNLTLSISTTFPVSYQWLKDGVELSGETTAQLQLNSALEPQSGAYSCLVGYEMVYGDWGDSLTALFYPNGPDSATANLEFSFGQVTIDEVLCHVGIHDAELGHGRIFPNPTSGTLNIELPASAATADISLFDVRGKQVLASHLSTSLSTIDVSALRSGLYLVQISSDAGVVHQRLIVN